MFSLQLSRSGSVPPRRGDLFEPDSKRRAVGGGPWTEASKSVLCRKGSLGFSTRMPGDRMRMGSWENGRQRCAQRKGP